MARSKKMPLDVSIMQAAYAARIPLLALDTPQLRDKARTAQVPASNGLAFECRLDQLFAVDQPEALMQLVAEEIRTMANLYRHGKTIDPKSLNSPSITLRNKAWMQAILPEVQKGNLFIAVGQLHLFGEEGLLKQLKARGYTIQPLGAQ
jgi:uncharacterized protein YbaP (TraB family)